MDIVALEKIPLTKNTINQVPTTTGVYLFFDKSEVVYIGKSVNLKARLVSHWENAKIDSKEAGIINSSTYISYIITDSELKALLLEAQLIQNHKPKYNVRWRDDKSNLYVKITKSEIYPKILIIRKEIPDNQSLYFGPFSSVHAVEELLRRIRRVIPFCMQKKITRQACFYSKIGQCSPCPSYIESLSSEEEKRTLKKEYRKNIRLIISIFQGKEDLVLSQLYTELKILSKEGKYEDAIQIRNAIARFDRMIHAQLFGNEILDVYNQSEEAMKELLHILQPYFPDLQSVPRIECFDISNLSQKEGTASLVVLTNGQIDHGNYRKFKIKNEKLRSDFEMLTEVLTRRFAHQNWPDPQLLIVDGGKPQVRTVALVLQQMKKTHIPLIGIAKHPDRLVINTPHYPMIRPVNTNLGFRMVQTIRDESHRFAKKYHTYLRNQKLFGKENKTASSPVV